MSKVSHNELNVSIHERQNRNLSADSTQALVTQIWSEILQVWDIGTGSNFFELGGDSLKAIEVISRIREAYKVEIPLIAFFEDPSVAHLAEIIDQSPRSGGDAVQVALAKIWAEVLQVADVSPNDNFFDLGGDSLKAIEVISRVRETLNVEIPLIAFFEDPTIAHAAEVISQMQENVAPPPVEATSGPVPLSFSQLTFWLLQQQDPAGYLYNEPRVLRIRGKFNADALQSALDALCARHEVLRTRFELGADEPHQAIFPSARIEIALQDLSGVAETDRERAAFETADGEFRRRFDLSTEPPLRVRLLKLDDEEHVLVVVIHHVLSDGYTSAIFFEELSALYNAQLSGTHANLQAPVRQYREYAVQERSEIAGARLDRDLAYWKSRLAGAPTSLDLPIDKLHPNEPSFRGETRRARVDRETLQHLKTFAHENGSTLFTLVLAGLRIVLQRWTSQQDLVIGTVASNRSAAGTERMLGCFLNFLPLRSTVSPSDALADVLARERSVVMDAFAHQACPFVQIAAAVQSERQRESNPIYNVALLLQSFPEMKFEGEGFSSEFLNLAEGTALLDLRFVASESEGGLNLDCEFKTALFEASTIDVLLQSYAQVLQALIAKPSQAIAELSLPPALLEQAQAARRRARKQTFAIVSTFTAEPIEVPLAFWTKQLGVRAEFAFAPYNQVFQQLLDHGSTLSRNTDGFNILLLRLTDWLRFEEHASDVEKQHKLTHAAEELCDSLKAQHSSAPVLVCFCPAEKKLTKDRSWSVFLPKLEADLAAKLEVMPGVHVITTDQVLGHYPVAEFEDSYADQIGHIPYTNDFFAALATMLVRRISALRSASKKVIVLDCDNTLWKGVCGEDGPTGVAVDSPRRKLQEFMLEQMKAGMLLCICSKNVSEDVDAVFAQNSGMILRQEHIAARRVNWNSKSQNLRELAADLQLGIDSFVFIDDNPIECAEVSEQCPEVLTLLLPQKTDEIPAFLRNVWALDHRKVTEEDAQRTAMYRQSVEREQLRRQAPTLDAFLANLELRLDLRLMEASDLTRVSQLTERTNQFNFTTIRRTEVEISQFLGRGGVCLVADLSDRFGNYGLVGVILYTIEKNSLDVDTMLLSCRALGRKVEHRMLARVGEIAQEKSLARVVVRFALTKKNQPAADFLNGVGAQFRIELENGFLYEFPAEYAIDLPNQRIASVEDEIGEASRRPMTASSASSDEQNRLVAKIANEFRDTSAIVRAIDAQRFEREEQTAYVAPGTPIEEIAAGIWASVLKVERVGLEDNFFSLGGHSLLATQAVARVRQSLGVELPLRSLFESPTLGDFASHIEEAQRGGSRGLPPITRQLRRDTLPLSFAQQRLWFLDQLEPGNPIYNVPQMFRIHGQLNRRGLEQALNRILERHESLRTTFPAQNGEPTQVVSPFLEITLGGQDLSAVPANNRESELERLAREEARRTFNLTSGPLVRAMLFIVAPDEHVLVMTMHHIISDRWSMGVITEELARHYSAIVQCQPSPLPDLQFQYCDFAVWQRNWLQGPVLDEQLTYWKRQLAGAPEALQLPADHPRPARMTMNGEIEARLLPRDVVRKLERLSQTQGVTLFMTLLAAFQTMLARYSGQDDIVVGSPIAGRNIAEVEPLIGFFVNTLALRADFSDDPRFVDLLARTKEVCLQAYAHQDIPFEKLVEEIQPERRLNQNPIFQVLFALQNAPLETPTLPNVTLERRPLHPGTSIFDMSWFAVEVPDGLMLRVEYSTDLFERETIARALDHFRTLLESALASPEARVSELPLLNEGERQKVLVDFNATETAFPAGYRLHDFFEETAASVPNSTALIAGSERITYGELNQRANRIAHHLTRLGAAPDKLIGVFLERTPDLIAAVLGVLKSGAAYVPLDPAYPRERLSAILHDAKAPIVVTQESLAPMVEGAGARCITIDGNRAELEREPDTNPATGVTPENLAYVLFTSGSTGRPKGVALEHRSSATFIHWAKSVFTKEELARVLFSTSVCFDLSIFEMFAPLSVGGAIVLVQNALYLPLADARDEVTLINTVPSAMAELVHNGGLPSSVRTVNLAGEALAPALVNRIYASTSVKSVYNLYGPTEDTTYSTYTRARPDERVTIGKPLPNTQAYILDKNLAPAPIGVAGELYLAGAGLARGYFGRDDLTAERFVSDPFGRQKNSRMYKTGDLCRWLANGNLEYLGRLDHQVKLRGFRIELGEIESAMDRHPAVRQSIVLAREDTPGEKRLAAYAVLQPGERLTLSELRSHLKANLPEYMLPSALVNLDAFPLTPNGKVDRKSLPVPEYGAADGVKPVKPRDAAEEILAGIWAEVLGLEDVGVEDNFFELGGHSLLATQIVARVRQAFKIELPLRALFEAPTVAKLAEQVHQLADKGPVLEAPSITPVEHTNAMPLSFGQQRLWFLDQLDPNNPVYNIPWTLKIAGSIDPQAIKHSLDAIVARHESLRTSFSTVNDEPVQIIHDSAEVAFQTFDYSGLPEELREAEARRLIAEHANRPFDLRRAPLLRALLVTFSKREHFLLLNIHHIVSDRWSLGILSQELSSLYAANTARQAASVPELPLQYADYAVWQRGWLTGDVLEKRLAYWKDKLIQAPALLELPTDYPRPAVETFRGDVAYVSFPRELRDKLRRLSRAHGATLFMALLGGFKALLSRYSGQHDVVIGTAVANRTHPDLEKVIGFFLNTLPLRTQLSGDPTFSEIIDRVKQTCLDAFSQQDVPFEKLVEELRPERNLSHSPLVQVFFVLQNAPTEDFRLSGLHLQHVPSGFKTVKGDLYLSMHETPEGLEAQLEFSGDLFDPSTANRILEHFRVLLEAAVDSPQTRLSKLPLLTSRERAQILFDWNATADEYPRALCVHQLFEQQAARLPDAVACMEPGKSGDRDRIISYRELNERANQLARALQRRGAGPGKFVGIFMERSLEMMVGLLGIQKSGAAYVPLDPAYPPERVRLTLEDANVSIVVSHESLESKLPAEKAEVLFLDRHWPEIGLQSTINLDRRVNPEDLIYVIFTSGSTGRPKGVQVSHRAVVNLLTFMGKTLGIGPGDVFPALASYAFDMCIPELYLALVSGGCAVICQKELAANGEELAQLLRRTGATVVHATPTTWRLLLDAGFTGKGLKRAIGAEPLPQELCSRLLRADTSLYNFYGPTETTVWSTYHHFTSADESVVVGRPIANTQVYILDAYLQPVPIGVNGEIYIGGDGISHGYLNRPDLTDDKFLANPFSQDSSAKMYRTGDIGRFLADGRIEFQGRSDHQVKIRGYRIELGEIETVLGKYPAVEQAVVVAREDVAGDKRLAAYVVPRNSSTVNWDELRDWVKQSLPEYMVPMAWLLLEKLPLSPNGKVDRKALPAPEYLKPQAGGDYAAPRTPEEETIAKIWCEVLKYPEIGIHEDFFHIGGHSLLATQVISRIRRSFNIDLPLRALFEAPTISGLARSLQAGKKEHGDVAPLISRAARPVRIPLSFAQQRLWFLDQLEPGNPLYNVAYVTRMRGALNERALEQSLNEIVIRHEALRTRFVSEDDQPVQVIETHQELQLAQADASTLPTAEACEAEARRLAAEEIQKPFDLVNGPVLRALLIRIADDDHALIIAMHHIVTDRWSIGVLSQELASLYEAKLQDKHSDLPDLELQYADYAVWQREYLSGDVMNRQLAYWRKQLEGAPEVLELKTDRPRKATEAFWGAQVHRPLPKDLADALKALAQRHQATFYMVLLAGFDLLMSRLSGQQDLVIGTDLANRTQLETERLIGFFVNLLPMRARVDHKATFAEFLRQVRETSLAAMAHQDIPFDKLVEEVRPERSLTHTPLVQVLFVMQNTPPVTRQFGGLALEPLGVGTSSRFDLVMFVNDPETTGSTTWMYNPNLFDAATVERVAELYEALLSQICATPHATVAEVFAVLDKFEMEHRESEQKKFEQAGRDKLRKIRRKTM